MEIETKRLQKVGDSIAVILPVRWLRKFCLTKGTSVYLVVMHDAIIIVDRNCDFNADFMKTELDLAQKTWDARDDKKQTHWFNKLFPEEQAKIRKSWEETNKDLTGKFDDSKSANM